MNVFLFCGADTTGFYNVFVVNDDVCNAGL